MRNRHRSIVETERNRVETKSSHRDRVDGKRNGDRVEKQTQRYSRDRGRGET